MKLFDRVQSTFGGAFLLCVVMAFEVGLISGIAGISDRDADKFIDDWKMSLFLASLGVSLFIATFGWATYTGALAALVRLFGEARVAMFLGTPNRRKMAGFIITLGIGFVILSVPLLIEHFLHRN